MAYDKKLKKAVEKAGAATEANGTTEFWVPGKKKYPHIHFYSDGCELRHGNSGGTKLIYASDQKNDGNIRDAKKEGGDIEKAAAAIDKYY